MEKLDPYLWFNNVERVAAARVEQEPVQYVRNIYKSYVPYKLIEAADAAQKGRDYRGDAAALETTLSLFW